MVSDSKTIDELDVPAKKVAFTTGMVEKWCSRAGDENPLHLDEEAASDSPFGQRVVPGMMLLDQVSGMVEEVGGPDTTVILAGVTAARFRDPVLLDEVVEITLDLVESEKRFTTVSFDARAVDRDTLVASGSINLVLE
jgi:itaconyl-CoA hydratase